MAAMPAQDPSDAPRPALHLAPSRWLLLTLAVVSLALGIAGIFLPLLPTVPFLLLAAWAASRSSPRLSRWLEDHPLFGQHLADWRRHGVVRRRAKWAASATMGASALAMVLMLHAHWITLAVVAMMACVLVWLWRRPEQRD